MKRLELGVPAVAMACLAYGICGCGGTRLDTDSVYALSTRDVLKTEVVAEDGRTVTKFLDETSLPAQSAANIKVYRECPAFRFFVVDTFYTDFSYEKGSATYRKIELKKHLKELRRRAGSCGAKGIIVDFGFHESDSGGVTSYDMFESDSPAAGGVAKYSPIYVPPSADVVKSDNMTTVPVKTYAIYFTDTD